MTIEFPKFPNDRRKRNQPPITGQSSFSLVNEGKVSQENNSEAFDATENLSPAPMIDSEITDLKLLLKTKKEKKPLNPKLLPLLLVLALVGALAGGAYYMYSNMSEAKTANTIPVPSTVTSNTTKATAVTSNPASAMASTVSTPTTTAVTMEATSQNPASQIIPTAANSQVTTSTTANTVASTTSTNTNAVSNNDTDLNKPLQVDSTPLSKNSAPPTKPTETKPIDFGEDSANSASTSTIKSNTVATKPAASGKTLSYDEFVKTSDTAVFIEPPTKQK